MFGKKKDSKFADGLFKTLQEVFMFKTENGSYELGEVTDSAAIIKFTLSNSYDWSKLTDAARARLAGEAPKDHEKVTLGTLSVRIIKEGSNLALFTKDMSFAIEKRFDVLSKEENKILEVQAERLLDMKILKKMASEALNLKGESASAIDLEKSGDREQGSSEVSMRLVPADVVDLRVLVNSINVYLGDIDVSGLDALTYAFAIYNANQVQENKRTDFDGIEKWDTSNIKSMLGVFAGCVNFNKDISMWNTSNVTDMSVMFASCKKFNQDISSFDTSKVETIKGMFYKCDAFNQDISGLDTSKVKDMSYTFYKARSFDQDLSSWNTESVKDDENMFLECPNMAVDKEHHPKLPSEDFKMKYYRDHVMTKSPQQRRAEFKKRMALILCFVIVILVFGLMNQPQA